MILHPYTTLTIPAKFYDKDFFFYVLQGKCVQHNNKNLIRSLLITSALKGQSTRDYNYHLRNFDRHSSGNIRKCANSASDATLLNKHAKSFDQLPY